MSIAKPVEVFPFTFITPRAISPSLICSFGMLDHRFLCVEPLPTLNSFTVNRLLALQRRSPEEISGIGMKPHFFPPRLAIVFLESEVDDGEDVPSDDIRTHWQIQPHLEARTASIP